MDVKNSDKDFSDTAKRLKQVRKKLDFTLDKMAEITGSSKTGISEMERNVKNPESKYLLGLAKVFRINVNWILTSRGTMFQPEVELDLDFGKDNRKIQELIFCLKNVDEVRYHILMEYTKFRRDHQAAIERALAEEKEKEGSAPEDT